MAGEIFDNIINQVRNSNLNFQMEVSPFSAAIYLKKSIIKDKSGKFLLQKLSTPKVEQYNEVILRNAALEMDIKNLQGSLAEVKASLAATERKLKIADEKLVNFLQQENNYKHQSHDLEYDNTNHDANYYQFNVLPDQRTNSGLSYLVDKSLPGCSSTPVPTKSLKNCSLKNFSCDSGVKLDDSATPMPVNTLSNSSKNSSCDFGENLSVSTAHTSTEALKKPVPHVEEDKTVLTSGNELIDKDEKTGELDEAIEDRLLQVLHHVKEDKTVLTSGNELIDKAENTGQPDVVVEDGLLKKRKRKNKKKKNHAKQCEQAGELCNTSEKKGSLDKSLGDSDYSLTRKANCELCHEVFNNERRLSIHKKEEHDPSNDNECDICSKTFLTEERWESHYELREGYCDICGICFNSHYNFYLHNLNLHDQTPKGKHIIKTWVNDSIKEDFRNGERCPCAKCNICDGNDELRDLK